MLGVCLASFSFILFSSIFGMPISGTHTVIGALIGAGFAGVAASDINWKKFGMTVASWFVSPVLSSLLAAILFLVICSLTLGGNVRNPSFKMTFVCLISGISLSFSCYMVIGLAVKNPPSAVWYSILGAFFVGIFSARAIMTQKANELAYKKMGTCEVIYSIFGFWTFDSIINNKVAEEKQFKPSLHFSNASYTSSENID